jgi:hypothetical protein
VEFAGVWSQAVGFVVVLLAGIWLALVAVKMFSYSVKFMKKCAKFVLLTLMRNNYI